MNITKAAKELRTSQPGLSKQLKGLQDEYDVKLFTRSGKRIELTEDGLELLNYIHPIKAQLEKIEQRFSKDYNKNKSTELLLGGTHEVSSTILPALIALFKKRHPKVQVVLRSNSIAAIEQMMLRGEIEMALTAIPPRSPELFKESCMPLKLVPFAAKKYPIAAAGLTLADLEMFPLIIRDNRESRGTTETVLMQLRDLGHRPNIALRCESPEAAVSKHLGIGILYDVSLKDEFARGLFKEVKIQGFSAEGNAYILCHKQRPVSPCATAFLKILRDFCAVKQNRKRK
jgi:DNA-binding transcriptional LysR family regulator